MLTTTTLLTHTNPATRQIDRFAVFVTGGPIPAERGWATDLRPLYEPVDSETWKPHLSEIAVGLHHLCDGAVVVTHDRASNVDPLQDALQAAGLPLIRPASIIDTDVLASWTRPFGTAALSVAAHLRACGGEPCAPANTGPARDKPVHQLLADCRSVARLYDHLTAVAARMDHEPNGQPGAQTRWDNARTALFTQHQKEVA